MIHEEKIVAFGASIGRARKIFRFGERIRRIPGDIPDVMIPIGWGTFGFGAGNDTFAIYDHIEKGWPRRAGFMGVHHIGEARGFECFFGLRCADVVFDDEGEDFVGMFIEELADVFESIDEQRIAEIADGMAQVKIFIPFVGIDQHGPNAVLELPIHAEILIGSGPAKFKIRHRIVRGGKRDFIVATGAEFRVAVAFGRRRDRDWFW